LELFDKYRKHKDTAAPIDMVRQQIGAPWYLMSFDDEYLNMPIPMTPDQKADIKRAMSDTWNKYEVVTHLYEGRNTVAHASDVSDKMQTFVDQAEKVIKEITVQMDKCRDQVDPLGFMEKEDIQPELQKWWQKHVKDTFLANYFQFIGALFVVDPPKLEEGKPIRDPLVLALKLAKKKYGDKFGDEMLTNETMSLIQDFENDDFSKWEFKPSEVVEKDVYEKEVGETFRSTSGPADGHTRIFALTRPDSKGKDDSKAMDMHNFSVQQGAAPAWVGEEFQKNASKSRDDIQKTIQEAKDRRQKSIGYSARPGHRKVSSRTDIANGCAGYACVPTTSQ